ncbi:protein DMR6-LIKE OXYGENASE 2-like isoform X2 [Punica granatum]|uniref:Protein DMR6-LIKE OXYGENASE 2-like isoform X2 n=1 Tax=Punica granatum TaxID=22663 RepID=A0A6P8C8X4_PUNGR|nr:protein DMR6-LIKE OXYGENASE 2-like isoform X2 [Punica granatum]
MAALNVRSVKTVAENPNLTHIPPMYAFQTLSRSVDQKISGDGAGEDEDPIPIIDLSLLTSGAHDQRSAVMQDLGNSCQEKGYFMVINHGIDEGLMNKMIDSCSQFFDLEQEEKRQYEGKHTLDPISYGTSVDASVTEVFFWRDYLRVLVHPEFHSPTKPSGFSEVLAEFTKAVRRVVRDLLGGISESLGLDSCYIDRAMDLESSLQLFGNAVNGLQVQHKGKWVDANIISGALFVNIGDHLEVLTNGKYKSVVHRAVVNNKSTRISIAMPHGPSLDTVVSPAAELLENGCPRANYTGMKYKDYLEIQHKSKLRGKTRLDLLKI